MRSAGKYCVFLLLLKSVLSDSGTSNQVVLLDTTTVLGELDWKTFPVNGHKGVPRTRKQGVRSNSTNFPRGKGRIWDGCGAFEFQCEPWAAQHKKAACSPDILPFEVDATVHRVDVLCEVFLGFDFDPAVILYLHQRVGVVSFTNCTLLSTSPKVEVGGMRIVG
ncbi:hypothetical protein GOODEAATRI_011180 [Goodea atripinnis]|uniref:Uncharacterized protein n=1 Tax=Goodea atripinnis TaxID=208336 RepID=A0ABV0NTL5_9TELE